MKLYYSKGACSLAIRILIYELNLPAEFESVDIRAKQTETGANYLKINPKGSVPALLLDNGELLTENNVIQQYLADTYEANVLLPPLGDFKRYRVLEWMNYVTTDLHKGCGPLFNAQVPDDVKEKVFKPLVNHRLHFIDAHLAEHEFLLGSHYTLPDGYLFVVLNWMHYFQIDLKNWLHITRYVNELKKRNSIERAWKAEGLMV